jgi:hypothetical protein
VTFSSWCSWVTGVYGVVYLIPFCTHAVGLQFGDVGHSRLPPSLRAYSIVSLLLELHCREHRTTAQVHATLLQSKSSVAVLLHWSILSERKIGLVV